MLRFEENPNLRSQWEDDLDVAMEAAAEASAKRLRERVSRPYQPRTGHLWDSYGYVFRSSAFGEYPQEQYGDLKRSVDSVKVSKMSYLVGFFGEDEEKLKQLEYTGKGRRMPLHMHFAGMDSGDTLSVMAKAIVGSR